jgi:hypothetical protein
MAERKSASCLGCRDRVGPAPEQVNPGLSVRVHAGSVAELFDREFRDGVRGVGRR